MAGRCPLRIGSEAQPKLNLGTTFTGRTSLLVVGCPRQAASPPLVQVPVRPKKFLLRVKWMVEHHLGWVVWVEDGKGLALQAYLIKLSMSRVACHRIMGKSTTITSYAVTL